MNQEWLKTFFFEELTDLIIKVNKKSKILLQCKVMDNWIQYYLGVVI